MAAEGAVDVAGTDIALEYDAVIPEPGTWAMFLGGMGMLVVWQRSRRGSNRAS